MMERRGIRRSFVSQFAKQPPERMNIPERCVASLNTHDTPTFAAFWGERPDPRAALRNNLNALSRSPAERVLVNVEDLWLEAAPQNIPGTGSEAKNWRRKTRLNLEEILADAAVQEELDLVAAARTQAAERDSG